jgi:hypothetical protein
MLYSIRKILLVVAWLPYLYRRMLRRLCALPPCFSDRIIAIPLGGTDIPYPFTTRLECLRVQPN